MVDKEQLEQNKSCNLKFELEIPVSILYFFLIREKRHIPSSLILYLYVFSLILKNLVLIQ